MTGSCLNKTARPNQRPGIPDPGSGHGGSGDVGSTASNLIYLRNRLSNSGFLAVCADRSPCFGASGYDLLEALHTTYRTAVDIPLRDPVNIPIFRKSTPGYICLGLCEVTARSFKRCLGRTEIRAREGSVARIKTVDSSNGAVVGGGAGFRDWTRNSSSGRRLSSSSGSVACTGVSRLCPQAEALVADLNPAARRRVVEDGLDRPQRADRIERREIELGVAILRRNGLPRRAFARPERGEGALRLAVRGQRGCARPTPAA